MTLTGKSLEWLCGYGGDGRGGNQPPRRVVSAVYVVYVTRSL